MNLESVSISLSERLNSLQLLMVLLIASLIYAGLVLWIASFEVCHGYHLHFLSCEGGLVSQSSGQGFWVAGEVSLFATGVVLIKFMQNFLRKLNVRN